METNTKSKEKLADWVLNTNYQTGKTPQYDKFIDCMSNIDDIIYYADRDYEAGRFDQPLEGALYVAFLYNMTHWFQVKGMTSDELFHKALAFFDRY